jgi:hypothetical protein
MCAYLSYDVTTNSRALFKEGGDAAPLLLPSTLASAGDAGTGAGRPPMDIPLGISGTNVVCAKCGAKLGRYALGEGSSSVDRDGAVAQGPMVRIARDKVDLEAGATAMISLIERSRAEAEDFLEEDGEAGARKGKTVKKKKRLKQSRPELEWGMSRNMQSGGSSKGGR